MADPVPVGFNPSDPTQVNFLSALASVENSSGNPMAGYGNVDLSGSATDAYGFPVWGGSSSASGATHAAGLFQFQPGTFDPIAQTYNLNFQNPADQETAAWILASNTYQQTTGSNLSTDLQTAAADKASGNTSGAGSIYTQIASALGGTWQGLQVNGSTFVNNALNGTGTALPQTTGSAPSGSSSSSGGSLFSIATWENFFQRFGLLILGGIIIIVALWALVANNSSLPGPGETAKAAGKALSLA